MTDTASIDTTDDEQPCTLTAAELSLHERWRSYGDNVVVVLDSTAERRLNSGLYRPGVAPGTTEGHWATVLAVGPGIPIPRFLTTTRRHNPVEQNPSVGQGWYQMETRVGDRVLLESGKAGDTIPVETLARLGLREGRHYRIVRECEIALVVEADDRAAQ